MDHDLSLTVTMCFSGMTVLIFTLSTLIVSFELAEENKAPYVLIEKLALCFWKDFGMDCSFKPRGGTQCIDMEKRDAALCLSAELYILIWTD